MRGLPALQHHASLVNDSWSCYGLAFRRKRTWHDDVHAILCRFVWIVAAGPALGQKNRPSCTLLMYIWAIVYGYKQWPLPHGTPRVGPRALVIPVCIILTEGLHLPDGCTKEERDEITRPLQLAWLVRTE